MEGKFLSDYKVTEDSGADVAWLGGYLVWDGWMDGLRRSISGR